MGVVGEGGERWGGGGRLWYEDFFSYCLASLTSQQQGNCIFETERKRIRKVRLL